MNRGVLLNDRLVSVDVADGARTLAWLREQHGLMGAKEGCGEGECGACSVLLGELAADRVVYRVAPACLLPAGELPGRHLVTIEGLNPPAGLNPVQQALVDAGAPQCGFCMPGLVVALTGFCLDSPTLSSADAVAAVDGNICRCTGYAAIRRAASSLSAALAGIARDPTARVAALVAARILPPHFLAAPDVLARRMRSPATTAAATATPAGLVGGATDLLASGRGDLVGQDLVFLSRRPDLRRIRRDGGTVEIGGAVTVSELRAAPELQDIIPRRALDLFAATVVRNRATVGGNLVNASPVGDLAVLLLALDAELVLARDDEARTVPLSAFHRGYKQVDLADGEIVALVRVASRGITSFEKVSLRRHFDVASVNSALRATRAGDGLREVRLAVGGVAPVPLLARATMAYLEGRPLDAAAAREAIACLNGEIAPIDDVRGSAVYKRDLAGRLLCAHLLALAPDRLRLEELI